MTLTELTRRLEASRACVVVGRTGRVHVIGHVSADVLQAVHRHRAEIVERSLAGHVGPWVTVTAPSDPSYRGLPIVARVVIAGDAPNFGAIMALAETLDPVTTEDRSAA